MRSTQHNLKQYTQWPTSSPLGTQQHAAPFNSASHLSNYCPVHQGADLAAPQQPPHHMAIPPSVKQHHNQPHRYHPTAAPPHIAQRNQIPMDEIRV